MKKFFALILTSATLSAAPPAQLHSELSKKNQPLNSRQNASATFKSSSKNLSTSPSENAPLDIKSLMSPSQQQTTGISQLSPDQLNSLQDWISHYIQSEQLGQNSVSGNQLAMVLAEGHYVKLGNGQVWNISPNAWIYTYYWQKGDPITVGKSGDMLFPVLLTNTTIGQSVNALVASEDTSKAFNESYTITKVTESGQFVTLSDGSTWQTENSSRFMVQSWAIGSPVFVVERPSATTGAKYELYNGTTTRSALANQLKAPNSPNLLLKPSNQATTFAPDQVNQATNQKTTFPSPTSNDGQNSSQSTQS
jgi:hypothetical protein